jgi:hypothetical protein
VLRNGRLFCGTALRLFKVAPSKATNSCRSYKDKYGTKIGKETRTRRIAIADLLGSADSACECCCDFKAQKHVLASIKSAASPARVILPQQQATSLNLDFARYPLNAFDKNSVSHFPGRACPVFLFIVFLYGCERVFVASGEEIV